MKLKDTIELMTSLDYKNRFKAEYYQLQNRYDGLDRMITKYEAKILDFTSNCSLELLNKQKYYMEEYLTILKIRAEIEGIDLQVKKDYDDIF